MPTFHSSMKLADEYQLKWIRGNFRLKVMYEEKAKHSQSLILDGLETVVGFHLNELSYLKIWEYDRHGQYTLDVTILLLLYFHLKNYAHYYSLPLHLCVKIYTYFFSLSLHPYFGSYTYFFSFSHFLFKYYIEKK